MAKHYPMVATDVNQILIEHADLITAGGMMAWVDLCLALIDRFIGRDAVIETAHRFVVDVGQRDQRRYRRFTPNLTHGDPGVRKAQLAIERDFDGKYSIRDLATVAGMSERTFIRRFSSITGLPPMAYVQAVRIEKSKDMLIHSNQIVQNIAFAAGYSDHSSFGRKFIQETGLTPTEFRNRFALKSAGAG
ncbi:GlxA family transcriptional regulator [Shimia abyssi]|nr:helix-turn-helix domain-containing protein [Shimia abyssi]